MMAETKVTVTTGTAQVNSDPGPQGAGRLPFGINVHYFRTTPGIIKLLQLVFGIICLGCASPAILSGTHWFLFVAACSFIATIIWVFVYLLNIRESLRLSVNWILTELLSTAVFALLYLIAFIVQLAIYSEFGYYSWTSWHSRNIAAGVFGLFNFLAYAAGTFFLFVEWKNSRIGN